jgi:hypothetical protein
MLLAGAAAAVEAVAVVVAAAAEVVAAVAAAAAWLQPRTKIPTSQLQWARWLSRSTRKGRRWRREAAVNFTAGKW